MRTKLIIPKPIYNDLKSHLLPYRQENEEAAFLFADSLQLDDRIILRFKELYKASPQDFLTRSSYHFELADEVRAKLIKKAHDLNASIIEFHSHLDPKFMQFSATDLMGFKEFVPHVLWRLKGRPYCAVVVTEKGFDALVWLKDIDNPTSLDVIEIDNKRITPSNNSLNQLKNGNR